jgi:hypothetical protein
MADIGLGALAANTLPRSWLPVVLTAFVSAGLYTSGMVWNDFFDVEQDRRERPDRPIPSGRVSRRTAGLLAATLMLVGVGFAVLTAYVLTVQGEMAAYQLTDKSLSALREGGLPELALSQLRPLKDKEFRNRDAFHQALSRRLDKADLEHSEDRILEVSGKTARPQNVLYIALGIVVAILLYDGVLKPSPLGPVAMGACRMGNVLLGIAGAGGMFGPEAVHLAAIVGVFVGGITWFARSEASESRQGELLAAAGLMFAGLLLALPLPLFWQEGQHASWVFLYLLVAFGFFVGLPASQAIAEPKPSLVQRAVKTALFGLVLLDAILATALAGWIGLLLLVLALPSLYLSRLRWLYAT